MRKVFFLHTINVCIYFIRNSPLGQVTLISICIYLSYLVFFFLHTMHTYKMMNYTCDANHIKSLAFGLEMMIFFLVCVCACFSMCLPVFVQTFVKPVLLEHLLLFILKVLGIEGLKGVLF